MGKNNMAEFMIKHGLKSIFTIDLVTPILIVEPIIPIKFDDFEIEDFEDFEKESEEETITFNDILESGEQIKLSDKRIIYKCKIKFICEAYTNNELSLSEHNRMIDNSRMEDLKANFSIDKCDSVILAKCINLEQPLYQIIDGQHRITMITQLEYDNPIMEEYILLDIRQCDNDEEFKEYINSTNNRKNFSSNQLRSFKYPMLKELLLNYFPQAFTAAYIKLDETVFKQELFKTRAFEDFDISPEVIVEQLKCINNFFKVIEDKSKLSTTHNLTKKSYVKHRAKSEQLNFFLGLDVKCQWMKLLDFTPFEFLTEWDKKFIKCAKV